MVDSHDVIASAIKKTGAVKAIASAMKHHPEHLQIQMDGCALLRCMAEKGYIGVRRIINAGGLSAILVDTCHGEDLGLLRLRGDCLRVLANMFSSDNLVMDRVHVDEIKCLGQTHATS